LGRLRRNVAGHSRKSAVEMSRLASRRLKMFPVPLLESHCHETRAQSMPDPGNPVRPRQPRNAWRVRGRSREAFLTHDRDTLRVLRPAAGRANDWGEKEGTVDQQPNAAIILRTRSRLSRARARHAPDWRSRFEPGAPTRGAACLSRCRRCGRRDACSVSNSAESLLNEPK